MKCGSRYDLTGCLGNRERVVVYPGMVRVLATCLLTVAASVSAFPLSFAWQGMDLARACSRREYVHRYGAHSICAQAQDSPRPRAEKKEEMRPIAEGLLKNLKDREAMTGTELDQDSFANRTNFDIVVKMRGNPEDILEKLGKSGLMTSAVVDTVILGSDKKRQRFGTKTEQGRRRLKDRRYTYSSYSLASACGASHSLIVRCSYFGTPLWQLVLRRSSVLTVLMMMQSLSSLVLTQYEELIQQNIFLSLFLTMLTGTGGNAGNQSSAIIIRGISTGEINSSNMLKAVGREVLACSQARSLACPALLR